MSSRPVTHAVVCLLAFASAAAASGPFSGLICGVALAHGVVRPGTDPRPTTPLGAQMPQQGEPTRDIALSLGHGRLFTLPSAMKDVFIADDKIADVQVKSAHQLYLFGKSSGVTTIYVSNAAGEVIWSANLRVGANIDSVDHMLALAMPEARITVTTMGTSTVLLTGAVANPEDIAEAQRLVQAFLGKDANVITRLKTATPLQVNLQVRIAEVSRTLMRQLGSNLATQGSMGSGFIGLARGRTAGTITSGLPANVMTGVNTAGMPVLDASTAYGLPAGSISLPFDAATGKFVAPGNGSPIYSMASNLSNTTAIGLAGHLFGLNVLDTLDIGEQMGLVTTLAQPNLTAISGESADFLAGGEFPIPMPGGLGTTSIEYKKFGVSLSYTPTVLADGRISLKVRPEVSELSTNGAISINGYSIPSLTVRRTETTVELGSGQSFMIAGLLSNNASHTIEKLPGAGDVPIIGALFRSTSFQQGETELVIVVTPYLVQPVNDGDIKLPTDGYQSPDAIREMLGDLVSKGNGSGKGDKNGSASRPGPKSAEDAAAGDSGEAQPAGGQKSGDITSHKHHPDPNDPAPTPGFSLP